MGGGFSSIKYKTKRSYIFTVIIGAAARVFIQSRYKCSSDNATIEPKQIRPGQILHLLQPGRPGTVQRFVFILESDNL